MGTRTPARASEQQLRHIGELRADPQNRRAHNPRNIGMLGDALQEVGAARSIVIDEDDLVLAGNGVIEAAAAVGITKLRVIEADGNEIIAVRRSGLSEEQKRKLAIYDNRVAELAEWNFEQLRADQAAGLDLTPFWTAAELSALFQPGGAGGGESGGEGTAAVPTVSLAERFGVPPFSVLDARQGYWQARKRAWLALGIQSELGRGADGSACPGGAPLPGIRGPRKEYKPGAKPERSA